MAWLTATGGHVIAGWSFERFRMSVWLKLLPQNPSWKHLGADCECITALLEESKLDETEVKTEEYCTTCGSEVVRRRRCFVNQPENKCFDCWFKESVAL